MEIGTKRENWVYWAVNHWGRLGRWVTGSIMTLLLTLFTTLTPAHAAVESVASNITWTNGWHGGSLTASAACVLFTYTPPFGSYFVGPVPTTDPSLPVGSMDCLFRSNNTDIRYGAAKPEQTLACPKPPDNPAIPYKYNPDNGMCERTVPDATCLIDPLPKFLLEADDSCMKSLEEGAGTDVKKACPDITDEMKKGAQCLADKIKALKMPGVDHNKQSANIRTKAYQQHLVDILKSSKSIEKLTDSQKQSCAAVIADVDAHVKHHGKITTPSRKGSQAPHVLGRAIDIPEAVVEALIARVSDTTFITPSYCLFCMPPTPVYIGDVEDYVNSSLVNPPACNLRWGGLFEPIPDFVHFQLY